MRPDQRHPGPLRPGRPRTGQSAAPGGRCRDGRNPGVEIVVEELVFRGMDASEARKLADALPQALQAALAADAAAFAPAVGRAGKPPGGAAGIPLMRAQWDGKPGAHPADAAGALAQTILGTLVSGTAPPSGGREGAP